MAHLKTRELFPMDTANERLASNNIEIEHLVMKEKSDCCLDRALYLLNLLMQVKNCLFGEYSSFIGTFLSFYSCLITHALELLLSTIHTDIPVRWKVRILDATYKLLIHWYTLFQQQLASSATDPETPDEHEEREEEAQQQDPNRSRNGESEGREKEEYGQEGARVHHSEKLLRPKVSMRNFEKLLCELYTVYLQECRVGKMHSEYARSLFQLVVFIEIHDVKEVIEVNTSNLFPDPGINCNIGLNLFLHFIVCLLILYLCYFLLTIRVLLLRRRSAIIAERIRVLRSSVSLLPIWMRTEAERSDLELNCKERERNSDQERES
jgi:hypothetical protein